jgi:hypothetical protein
LHDLYRLTLAIHKPFDTGFIANGSKRSKSMILYPWAFLMHLTDLVHPILYGTLARGFNFHLSETVHQSDMMVMVFAKQRSTSCHDSKAFVQ